MRLDRRFAGKERDEETGLDYFEARYMSSAQARFTSPDKPFADQTPFDLQSWNLYSYTRNNPLKYVDRTGEAIETAWDVVNISLGVASFVSNVSQGNYLSATVDAVGVALDSAAAVVPFVPGGAGTLIKAGRLADKAVDAAEVVTTVNRLDNVTGVVREKGTYTFSTCFREKGTYTYFPFLSPPCVWPSHLAPFWPLDLAPLRRIHGFAPGAPADAGATRRSETVLPFRQHSRCGGVAECAGSVGKGVECSAGQRARRPYG